MLLPRFGLFEVLSRDDLYRIHSTSLQILEKIGVKIDDEDTLHLLDENGCDVDFRSKVAKIPQYLVEECIRWAPRTVLFAGRSKKYDLRLEDKRVHFGTGSGCLNIYDIETGEWRPTRKKDVEDAARLVNALPNIDFVMSLACSRDVPSKLLSLHDLDAMLRNTEKPIKIYDYGIDANYFIEMAAAVVGGREELRRRPILCWDSQPVPPLTHDKIVRNLRTFAEAGLPQVFVAAPKMGFSAPLTIAGWAAQANAEFLSGNVIAQLTRKGAPFIYAYGVPTMDLKTAVVSYVSPEFLITNPLMAQLGRFYGFPTWSTAGASDSKVLDTQALAQASLSLYNCALSGVNLVHDVGFLDIGLTASFELVVICDELISFLGRALSGCEITDETLAFDIISKVGVGGHFLAEEHSRKHLKDEYWSPSLLDRQNRKAWLAGGGKDLNMRAREKARRILREHEAPALPRDVQQELDNILKRAEAELVS